jgi:hypothetical protein
LKTKFGRLDYIGRVKSENDTSYNRVIKWRWMRWVRHVARIEEIRNTLKNFSYRRCRKRPTHRWGDHVKIYLDCHLLVHNFYLIILKTWNFTCKIDLPKETGYKNVVQIHLVQDWGKWQVIVNKLWTFRFHKWKGISWTAECLFSSQDGFCYMELVQ